MKGNLKDLNNFLLLISKFQLIKRKTLILDTDEYENDAAHSFHLAITAWYILQKTNARKLNINKVIKYCLVHDLVEVYAGDVSIHAQTPEVRKIKEQNEELAFKRIVEEFPDFKEYAELYHKYENRADKESRFVYALDKLIPIFQSILSNGKSWKNQKVTLESLIKVKENKILQDPDIFVLWEELKDYLKSNQELFYSK